MSYLFQVFANYQLESFVFISLSDCIKSSETLMSLTATFLGMNYISPKLPANYTVSSPVLGKMKPAPGYVDTGKN